MKVIFAILLIIQFIHYSQCSFFDPLRRVRSTAPPPPVLDLRQSKRVFSPVDQKQCNLCFVSSALTAFEYWSGTPLSLQYTLDCSRAKGTSPCKRGGDVNHVMVWAQTHGIPLEAANPADVTADGLCPTTMPSTVFFQLHEYGSESDVSSARLQELLWRYGPVITNMNVDTEAKELTCTKNSIHHSIAVVGYTEHYFIIKNSWGSNWKDKGYDTLPRGSHSCGFARRVWYVKMASLRT